VIHLIPRMMVILRSSNEGSPNSDFLIGMLDTVT